MRVFKGNYLEVSFKKYKGKKYETIKSPNSVAILAVYKGNIVLVEQYRPALEKYTIELPAGIIKKGEAPKKTAIRELREETGYFPKDISHVLSYFHTPGYGVGVTHLFYSDSLIKAKERVEKEKIKARVVSIDKAVELIKKGKIKDPNALIGLNLLLSGLIKNFL
jgi:ADP-ribose pyrophosphatase